MPLSLHGFKTVRAYSFYLSNISTGLDYGTLAHYARVAKKVPLVVRATSLSWEHQKKVAGLKDQKAKVKWLTIAAAAQEKGEPISTRILFYAYLASEVQLSDRSDKLSWQHYIRRSPKSKTMKKRLNGSGTSYWARPYHFSLRNENLTLLIVQQRFIFGKGSSSRGAARSRRCSKNSFFHFSLRNENLS